MHEEDGESTIRNGSTPNVVAQSFSSTGSLYVPNIEIYTDCIRQCLLVY